MSKYRIDDNGTVRDMTPEEIAAWEAECAAYGQQLDTSTIEDLADLNARDDVDSEMLEAESATDVVAKGINMEV